MKIQINHWLNQESRFCGYSEAKVVEGDLHQSDRRPDDGNRFTIIMGKGEDLTYRKMIGAEMSYYGAEFSVSGFVEIPGQGPFSHTGKYVRELWTVLTEST